MPPRVLGVELLLPQWSDRFLVFLQVRLFVIHRVTLEVSSNDLHLSDVPVAKALSPYFECLPHRGMGA